MNKELVSVVIFESQPLMRTALSTTLTAEGMTVLSELAESERVMQTAKKLTPDLILFSVRHPSLDDLQRISALRKSLPSTLILALITGEFRGQKQTALEFGAHAVVTKSASRWELLEAIQQLKKLQPAGSVATL